MSIIPLAYGTAKGTFYAMFFALPLAVLAAIYTSEFAHPRVRNVVKPTVELMASLPSVILGFLGGLWLAPLLDRQVVGGSVAVADCGADDNLRFLDLVQAARPAEEPAPGT